MKDLSEDSYVVKGSVDWHRNEDSNSQHSEVHFPCKLNSSPCKLNSSQKTKEIKEGGFSECCSYLLNYVLPLHSPCYGQIYSTLILQRENWNTEQSTHIPQEDRGPSWLLGTRLHEHNLQMKAPSWTPSWLHTHTQAKKTPQELNGGNTMSVKGSQAAIQFRQLEEIDTSTKIIRWAKICSTKPSGKEQLEKSSIKPFLLAFPYINSQ